MGEKTNFNLMIRYIAQKENLKVAMTLLKSDSNAISHEAFHIFKVFVANPKKARDIHIVLWKNKEKLIQFLTNFLPEKAKEDEALAEEKKIVIKHLEELPIPDEIAQHKKRQEKKRAQSQADAGQLKGSPEKMHGSKSVPHVQPPPQAQGDAQNNQEEPPSKSPKQDEPSDEP